MDFYIGDILWLPFVDPIDAFIPYYFLDHPVLILCSQGADIMVCSITTKFPSQRSLRLGHIPLAPADPHPDTSELFETEWTGTPSVTFRPSYVKLNNVFIIPSRVLEPLLGGTAKLTIEALAMVTKKILDSEESQARVPSEWLANLRRVKKAMSMPIIRRPLRSPTVSRSRAPGGGCRENYWAPIQFLNSC